MAKTALLKFRKGNLHPTTLFSWYLHVTISSFGFHMKLLELLIQTYDVHQPLLLTIRSIFL